MSLIRWTDTLLIGNEEVDQEHKALVDIVNSLHTGAREGLDAEQIRRIFFDLYSYTNTHFLHEEALMRSIGYPDLAAHKKEHEQLIDRLDVLAERAKRGDTFIAESTFHFLVDWLLDHIGNTDMKIKAFLPHGVPETPGAGNEK